MLPLCKVQRANQNPNEELPTSDMAGVGNAALCKWRLAIRHFWLYTVIIASRSLYMS